MVKLLQPFSRGIVLISNNKTGAAAAAAAAAAATSSTFHSSTIVGPIIPRGGRQIISIRNNKGAVLWWSMAGEYRFGAYKIDPNEVFYSSHLSYARSISALFFLVLVCPRREVKRFVDLTDAETSDLWIVARKVGKQLEYHHKASSLTFTIQDGPQAGQTVPHVHIHIIPRKGGDFEKNDEIYDAIDEMEKELKQTLDLDKERKDRTLEEMAQEAEAYRKLFI